MPSFSRHTSDEPEGYEDAPASPGPEPAPNAAAGPSTPPAPDPSAPHAHFDTPSTPTRKPSLIPPSSPSSEPESTSIQAHLDRRRRSTALHRHAHLHHLRKHSKAEVEDEGEGEGAHRHGDGQGHRLVNGHGLNGEEHARIHVAPYDESEAERAEREAEYERARAEEAAAREAIPPRISILRDGREWDAEGEEEGEGAGEGLGKPPRGFAWDVLFENQRGIHFLGKAYFSANSLLPLDPSPYTVPSHPLPSASSLRISPNPKPSSGPLDLTKTSNIPRTSAFHRSARSHANPAIPASHRAYAANVRVNLDARRDPRTAYTPATAQVPDPAWSWVTPWMINMKVGSDEGGWRYNAWFREKGWRAHAGPVGWGGWVRRREWVRLRAVGVGDNQRAEGVGGEEGEDDIKGVELGEEPVGALLKAMGKVMVDRERLEQWERWVKDEGMREGLESIARDDDKIHELRSGFTYDSNYRLMRKILLDHFPHARPDDNEGYTVSST